MKKIFVSFLTLGILFLNAPDVLLAEEQSITFDINEVSEGDVFILYEDDETTVTIEVVKKEVEEMNPFSRYVGGSGNSGWSGGWIPNYAVTMKVSVKTHAIGWGSYVEYYVDANRGDVTGVSRLNYKIQSFSMSSSSFSYNKRRAWFSFQGHVGKNARSGHVTFDINTSGKVRTTNLFTHISIHF